MNTFASSVGKMAASPKRILFYAHKDDPDGKRLLTAVAGVIPRGSLEIYREISDLAQGLRAPGSAGVIVVLLASKQEELKDFFRFRDLLAYVPLILVVPGQDEETIQWAHQMVPRFLSQKDSDFVNLSRVLEKMFQARS